jgi:hypothetical protein
MPVQSTQAALAGISKALREIDRTIKQILQKQAPPPPPK